MCLSSSNHYRALGLSLNLDGHSIYSAYSSATQTTTEVLKQPLSNI